MMMMVERRAAAQASAKRKRRRAGMSAANVGASDNLNSILNDNESLTQGAPGLLIEPLRQSA